MSDSPVYHPPYLRPSHATDVEMQTSRERVDDIEDDPDVEDEDEPPPPRERLPVREGLPPTYRMRHEPHYVEALVAALPTVMTPPAAPDPLPPGTAPVVEAPTRSPDLAATAPRELAATSPLGRAAASALTDALDAIQQSLEQLPSRARSLRERVGIDLARAEAVRARWIAESALVLQHDPLPSLDEVELGSVFRAVGVALAPEYRLAAGAPLVTMPEASCSVFGDESLLTVALGAALGALRRLIEERGDPSRVHVSIAPRLDTASRTIEIVQSAVRVPASAHARFFDAEWAEHPAGAVGALMLAAARRIAVAHGGSLEIAAADHGGFRLQMSLPAAG